MEFQKAVLIIALVVLVISVIIIAAIVASFFVFKYARKQQEQTGRQLPSFYITGAIIIIFSFLANDEKMSVVFPGIFSAKLKFECFFLFVENK